MSISPTRRRAINIILPTWLLIILSATLSPSCRQPPQPAKAEEPPPSPVPWKTIEPPAQVGVTEGGTPIAQPSVVVGKPYSGTGVVIFINRKEGWVEINHEAIEGLMPAMQMEWPVKDKAMLNSIRVGDKIVFAVVETGKGEVLSELKKAP